MFAKLKGFLLIPICFFIAAIVMPSIASSGLIWPLKIGDTYKFIEHDKEEGEDPSYEYSIVAEKVKINSIDYFHFPEIDPVSGDIIPGGEDAYLRSTEDAIYQYNPDGDEIIVFQSGTIGTTWYNYDPEGDDEVYKHYFYEIVDDDATVDFLFGHEPLTGAYKCRIHMCSDFEETNCSSEYELFWIMPNLGYVKAVEMPDQGDYLYWFELSEIIPPRNSKVIMPGIPLLLLDP